MRFVCVRGQNKYSIIRNEVVDMKKFTKWLGINDKLAKVITWILIAMLMLIIINAALKSVGFPEYQITYYNIKNLFK